MNADETRRVGIHDPCSTSLCSAFTSGDGVFVVFDPKSRYVCYPGADVVLVETSSSAQANGFVVGREICWDVR